jgi:hypothetical protein
LIVVASAIIFGLLRVVGRRVRFETVVQSVAYAVSWIPIIAASWMFGACLAFGAALVIVALYPPIEAWPVWGLLPMWVWLVLPTASVQVFSLVSWWWEQRPSRRTDPAINAKQVKRTSMD